MTQANQEVTGLHDERREQEVLVDITITPQGIPIREQATTQVYPLSEGIRDLGWMSCKEK
jgi:hypothetical protein